MAPPAAPPAPAPAALDPALPLPPAELPPLVPCPATLVPPPEPAVLDTLPPMLWPACALLVPALASEPPRLLELPPLVENKPEASFEPQATARGNERVTRQRRAERCANFMKVLLKTTLGRATSYRVVTIQH